MSDRLRTGGLAVAKLTANWWSIVEVNSFTATEQAELERGQRILFERGPSG
jgi:hypothetical protein